MTDATTPAARAPGRLRGLGRTRLLQLLAVLVVLAVAIPTVVLLGTGGTYRITARFAATPGLYADNDVDILGVPSGSIDSITPRSGWVDVVLTLPEDVKVPADAKAVLMAPNPVSDRFVELTPAWQPGMATMPAGSVIGRDRTFVPLELDQIFSSVSNLSKALGPTGGNAHGELSSVLRAFANLADGNGKNLNETIAAVSAALPALTQNPDQLQQLISGLDRLTGALVQRNDTINSLYGDLATATGQLADERTSLSTAIANLQQGLAQVAAFVAANKDHITGNLANLNTVLSAVLSEQQALISTFDTAALGFSNFNRAVDPNGPCVSATGAPMNCSGLWGRLDFTKNAAAIVKTYCGDNLVQSMAPIILQNLKLATATGTDTTCGAQAALLQNRVGPAGSPANPDLDLTHYLAR